MNGVKIKSILKKNASVLYFERTSAFEDLESISVEIKSFHPGYYLFRNGILSRLIGKSEEVLKLDDKFTLAYGSSLLGIAYQYQK